MLCLTAVCTYMFWCEKHESWCCRHAFGFDFWEILIPRNHHTVHVWYGTTCEQMSIHCISAPLTAGFPKLNVLKELSQHENLCFWVNRTPYICNGNIKSFGLLWIISMDYLPGEKSPSPSPFGQPMISLIFFRVSCSIRTNTGAISYVNLNRHTQEDHI